jgi:hypothetical protein
VTLPTDGSIVALPDETVPTPMPIKLKALMNEKVLAMATSDVDDAALTALGVVDTNDGTILRYAVGGEFFAMIDRLMPPTPAEMPEYEAKMAEHSRQMMAALGSKVDVIDVRVQLTGRGLEMNQVMTLK